MQPDEKARSAQGWYAKTHRDLLAAEQVLLAKPPLTDACLFHCQQAVEKAMKGFLTFHQKRFTKTHALAVLASNVVEVDPSLKDLCEKTYGLTAFAVALRYPDESWQTLPTIGEAEDALNLAREVFEQFLAKLPQTVRPSKQ